MASVSQMTFARADGDRRPEGERDAAVGNDSMWAMHHRLRPAVTATYWFDVDVRSQGKPVDIRFTGHRTGVRGKPGAGDTFVKTERVASVVPCSGPLAVTTRVRDLNPGHWSVSAKPVSGRGRGPSPHPARPQPAARQHRIMGLLWSKGNPIEAGSVELSTRPGPLATAPGIIVGSWFGFVAVGVVVAFVLLVAIGRRLDIPAAPAVGVAVAASIAGAVGSRLWYVALQRGRVHGPRNQGLCIQGFITGMVMVGLGGLALTDIAVGRFLDALTPGLFFAMALGRQGCFFTGCCGGRPTASRWGVWSSDGRVGARRIPTQQMESLLCLSIGVVTLLLAVPADQAGRGGLFVGAMAVYTLGRQALFGLRAEPRRTSSGRILTISAATVVLVADFVVLAVT